VSRIFSHKIWGAALLLPLKEHYDIHLFEKSVHLFTVSPAKQIFHPEFRHTSAARLK